MERNINSLIARVLSGNGSPEDQQRIDTWLSQSAANRAEYERMLHIWKTSAALKKDSDVDVRLLGKISKKEHRLPCLK